MEEFDPAFRELVQTTNSTASQDVENDADSLDGDESGMEDAGAALLDTAAEDSEETDTTDVWITSVYEERIELESLSSKRVVAVASVDVRAHKVQCVTFSFSGRGDSNTIEQDFSSYLNLLKVMYPLMEFCLQKILVVVILQIFSFSFSRRRLFTVRIRRTVL